MSWIVDNDKIRSMRTIGLWKATLAAGVLLALSLLVYRLPPVYSRLSWRLDAAQTYLRGVVSPVQGVPTPVALAAPQVLTTRVVTPSPTPMPAPTSIPAGQELEPTMPPASPTPLPESISLASPAWEKQDWNNCGPATLAQYLRFYGWEGDQFTISDLLKPERGDRNVNVEELVYYVRTRAGWLNAEFRVGGDIPLLKSFLAAGIPVMVEEGFRLDTTYWPNDDRWAGHYLLLTGYDDTTGTFTGQDSFIGADQQVDYETLDENWRVFNRVYILLFRPEQENVVRSILGPHWDVDYNRQHATGNARAEVEANPADAFGWFNLGTNLVYFERYEEAARAYDEARQLGLPQRMLRYQFGPFFAYFHSGRNEDLLTLTDYALQRTPNAEEALLWHGWGNYREGNIGTAIGDFQAALEANRFYQDAQFAIDFVLASE